MLDFSGVGVGIAATHAVQPTEQTYMLLEEVRVETVVLVVIPVSLHPFIVLVIHAVEVTVATM